MIVRDIPDVNVWASLVLPTHQFHATSRRYWTESAAPQVCFTWVTTAGFLRIVSNSSVAGGRPLDAREAWRRFGDLLREPWISMLDEAPLDYAAIDRWVVEGLVSPRLWSDVTIAAQALATGSRVVTFDRDFLRFNGLDVLLLDPTQNANTSEA